MRGLLLHPAGVPVLVLCEDPAEDLWQGVLAAWGSLAPTTLEDADARASEGVRLVLLTVRPQAEALADYPQAREPSVIDSQDPLLAAERLTVHITMHVLKEYAGHKHLLHAAVLADPKTREAVALVAASGTGKTTAARVLGRDLTYLSDETAVIDRETLQVLPYPKPLSIIEDPALPKMQYDPAHRGLAVAAAETKYTLAHLVLLERDKNGEAPVSWERLPLADALFSVILQSSGVQQMPEGLKELAILVNRLGGAVKLKYSEIEEALPFFQQLLAGELPLEPLVQDFDYLQAPQRPEIGKSDQGVKLYQQTSGSEILATDEDYLMATRGQLARISIIGWDIWSAAQTPVTAEQLYEQMEDLYGEIHPNAFESALRDMVSQQMLEVTFRPEAEVTL